MAGAVLPPLDGLATQLFSAHMAQHELMMLVAAPLMIAGRPMSTCLWGMPDPLRPYAAAPLQRPGVSAGWRLLSTPLIAWALHGLVVWVWHVPALYERAVADEAVHAVQHFTFVGTSVLFWWGLVYGRYGRAGYGAAVFYVFTTVVHTGILGALLTFAGTPLYQVYVRAAGPGGDPLADQQLAGLIMWVPAGIVLTLLGIGLFAAWLGEAERRARWRTLPVVLLGVWAAGCGDSSTTRIARELTGGEPDRGRQVVTNYGCDTCHTIPGVLTADATVGPPLTAFASRSYIAGRLENTPENLMFWIRQPHSVDDKTAMPETGVTEADARHIAAYLYTLR
jgi:cytochrome c oxidase assembly factor CtaG/cytochrome c2